MVANQQLYLVTGIPLLFNTSLIGILIVFLDSKFDARFDVLNTRLEGIDKRFEAIDRRFDDMRDLWRAELHRVEEVLDARLKHIEERREQAIL
ncbi:MAG TPA: hypothetical protein VFW94_14615 [Candidatus Acidoferrales bacterium]|nr:hypothetical protein [Candidatus Acidoferrales bacterium]